MYQKKLNIFLGVINLSQKTINYETKINDLKKVAKEIITTPIYSLQVCVDLKMFVPILEPIFIRYNISRIRFAKYIVHIFTYIKRILEAQGKNFDSESELCIIALISGEDLLSIIKIFIYFIMGIKDNNEISKIQQQIISELNQQKFESQDIFPLPILQLQQMLNVPLFKDLDVTKKVFGQNHLYNSNTFKEFRKQLDEYANLDFYENHKQILQYIKNLYWNFKKNYEQIGQYNPNVDSEEYETGFIFADKSEPNLFEEISKLFGHTTSENLNPNSSSHPTFLNHSKFGNDIKIFGHNISENSNQYPIDSDFSDNESNKNDLSSSEILNSLFISEDELNRNQIIEQQIEQVELDQDRNELSNLIKMLNDMRDKLSEIFSPQAIKNVINFLEDILKNNNDNEINSVCNIIHEFDDINSISVVHFLHNFSKHYPLLMNENFDFEKLVDFIENELFKEDIDYWKIVLEISCFNDLTDAVKWNFSVPQYKYLVKNFLSEIEKNSNKKIEEIREPGRGISVTEILNQYDLEILRNKLIIPGTDYPMKRTQEDLNREKIARFVNELQNLQKKGKILSYKEYICIFKYCEHTVDNNNSETEKINHFCSLISNFPNGIDRTLVDSLLELASLFQLKKIFFISPQCRDNAIVCWGLDYDENKEDLNKIELSSKFQPILDLAEALNNYQGKLLNYFSNEQIINLINFIGDICEKNNINEINSIINMIQEFNNINDISNIIHFLYNFSRRYPEVMGTGPIPNSEIDKSEIEH